MQLQRVTKVFADQVAVDALDLAANRGEFFTLLGPSGCGKTTTLRMVAGLEEPTEGRILIDGAEISDRPPHRRPTNTVFQSYALFPHLSVRDNVAFGLRRRGVDGDELTRRVNEELERVGLASEGGRKPNQLSGGQQQRVAVARALVNLPKVLLLDEPLGALDLKLRKGLQVELKRIQQEVGITFVYVTHDQEEALTMSDRVAVMNRGRIEQCGGAEEIYERPATAFVADFIGVSNLIPATVRSGGGGRVRLRLETGLELDTAGDLPGGERCQVIVRPEKLHVEPIDRGPHNGRARDGWPRAEGLVESSVYLGTATQLVVALSEGVRMTVLVPNSDESERNRLPGAGARVRLSWAPQHMHLLSSNERADIDPVSEPSQREEIK